MSITIKTGSKTGAAFQEDIKTVVVHDGRRGPQGKEGDDGDPGDPGLGINVLGPWSSGQTYCPNDAVRDRSTVVDHVWSLYIQRTDQPCAPSTTPPYLDTGRWQEVGPYEWGNYLGGIWEVTQLNHGFTKVGQPVAYSFQTDSYILADCRRNDELPIGVVREIMSVDRVSLQSSGEVPLIDPTVIFPDGSDWQPGRVYYVSTIRGRLQLEQPTDTSYFICPILMPTDVNQPSNGRNGVALPWTPGGGPGSSNFIATGWTKFYFTAVGGETSLSGTDDRGNELAYVVGENTDVFLNGANLISQTDFTAPDGLVINFTTPLDAGDGVEIWTPEQPLDILVPSTILKLDNIEGQFDGVERVFSLTVSSLAVELASASNTLIWQDGNNQEPLVDYNVINDPLNPGFSAIEYAIAPPRGTRFHGSILAPVPDPVATTLGPITPGAPGTENDVALLVRVDGDWKVITLNAAQVTALEAITGSLS